MIKWGRYEKIVIISTFDKPRALGEISQKWYGNKGRLYQEKIQGEIDNSIKKGRLKKVGKSFQATPSAIREIIKDIDIGQNNVLVSKYKQALDTIYLGLGDFSLKTYLSLDIFLALTEGYEKKIRDIDLGLVLQLPFFLRFTDKKSKTIYFFLIQALDLVKYSSKILNLELQNLHILHKSDRLKTFIKASEMMETLIPKMEKKGLPHISRGLKGMKAFGRI